MNATKDPSYGNSGSSIVEYGDKNIDMTSKTIIELYFKKNSLYINCKDIIQLQLQLQLLESKNKNSISRISNSQQLSDKSKPKSNHDDDDDDDNDDNDDDNDDDSNLAGTLPADNLLNSLTESCFILSDSFIAHQQQQQHQRQRQQFRDEQGRIDFDFLNLELELQKKKDCKYFALRQEQREESASTTNENGLLVKTFASLSIRSNTNTNTITERNDTFSTSLLEVSSRFVALQMMDDRQRATTTAVIAGGNPIMNTSTMRRKEKNSSTNGRIANSHPGGGGGKFSSLFGISKKIYTKASTVVTSVLASYDLAEDPNAYSYNGHEDQEKDEDDAFLLNEQYYSDNADVDHDHDDAQEYYNDEKQQQQQKLHSDYTTADDIVSLVLDETDILWNVELIVDCCLIILHHVKVTISTLKAGDINEQLTTVTARATVTDAGTNIDTDIDTEKTFTNSSPDAIMNGIILNKIGDGPMSFLVFCHQAGLAAATSYSSEALSLHHTCTNNDHDHDHYHVHVGRILQHIIPGPSLEILMLTLLQTNNIIPSSHGDSIVLIPTPNPTPCIYQNVIVGRQQCKGNSYKYIVNDVDIAAFKLNSTIQSIEKRIDVLTDQSEVLRQKALSSKQQQRGGNYTKIAIIHMKRRQLLLNEIDRCSASLLNLESGLHSLRRAHSDAQIVKAYEMMNNTMKAMREETSLSQVEAVMEDFYDGNEEIQQVQDSLVGSIPTTDDLVYDIDELEKELQALGGDNGGDSGPNSDEGNRKRIPNEDGGDSSEIRDDKVKDTQQPTPAPAPALPVLSLRKFD